MLPPSPRVQKDSRKSKIWLRRSLKSFRNLELHSHSVEGVLSFEKLFRKPFKRYQYSRPSSVEQSQLNHMLPWLGLAF